MAGVAAVLSVQPPVASQTARPQTTFRAEQLIHEGEWDQSIQLLGQVLSHNPANVQARNLMGIALTGKGDLTAANAEYRKALKVRPNFVPAIKNLAINELTQHLDQNALRDFGEALKLAPNDPVIHAYLGKIAYSQGKYKSAAEHLARSGELVQDPSVAIELLESYLQTQNECGARQLLGTIDQRKFNSQWNFRLGIVLARHHMFAEAIPFFEYVGSNAPEWRDAMFDLAVSFLETKQFPHAIETIQRMAGNSKRSAELDMLLAEAYEQNQQTQEAIDALREAVQLAPENEDGFVDLAALCIKYEAYDIGMQVIQTGLQNHPKSDRLIFQRGVIYALKGQFELAEADFQHSSQLAPEKNLGYAALGVSYAQAGSPEKALASLRERVAQRPDDAMAQFLLGDTLLRTGVAPDSREFAEARRALERSATLDPKSADSRLALAKLYLKENRANDAVSILEQARNLDPENNAVYLQLVVAYRRQGKTALAESALKKLNEMNEQDSTLNPHRRVLKLAGEPGP
jgi:tetratricopeptide (TPR) repeat protein